MKLRNGDEDRLGGPNSIVVVEGYFPKMGLIHLVVHVDNRRVRPSGCCTNVSERNGRWERRRIDGAESGIHISNVHGDGIVRVEVYQRHIVLGESKRNNIHSAIEVGRVESFWFSRLAALWIVPRTVEKKNLTVSRTSDFIISIAGT